MSRPSSTRMFCIRLTSILPTTTACHHTSKSWFYRDLETATAGKVKDQRVRKGGDSFHNVVGAKLNSAKPVGQTEEDVGLPGEDDIWLDAAIKKRLAAA